MALSAGALSIDALSDTVRLMATVRDSLGTPLANPQVSFVSSDPSVAVVDVGGLVTTRGNGSATIVAEGGVGVTDSTRVTVSQRVAWVTVAHDTLHFDALNAVLPLVAVAWDRLGSVVPDALLTYATEDGSVATVDASGNVRALGNGATVVTASDGQVTTSVGVQVAQRPVRLVLPSDTVHFDALGQDRTIVATVLDALGSPVDASVANLTVADAGVVEAVDSTTARAKANGVTS